MSEKGDTPLSLKSHRECTKFRKRKRDQPTLGALASIPGINLTATGRTRN